MEINHINSNTTESHPITVLKAQYATSLDERGFIPVFEYKINGQSIMWDRETRDVFLTGIWKALGHTKVDVIKTVHANSDMKSKRIRGGLLNIQGTWVSFEDAKSLCIRAAWIIRHQLVPIFGPGIVEDCLPPDHPNYCVVYLGMHPLLTKKRRFTIKAPSVPLTSPSSTSPMALSNILNNDNYDPQDPENGNYDTMAYTGTVAEGDGDYIGDQGASPQVVPTYFPPAADASPPLDFQVVPESFPALMDSPLSSSTNDWSTLDGIAIGAASSPLFDNWNDATCIWDKDDVQDSIETIQAAIILHGLPHQDMLAARETVPDKVTRNGKKFYVLWE